MDSPSPTTPPSRRSARRLLPDADTDTIATPPYQKRPSSSPLRLPLPLQDLLLLSHSPHQRPKPKPIINDPMDPTSPSPTPRRKPRSRTAAAAANLMACTSPRNVRRARRRLDKETVRDEMEVGVDDGVVEKVRKRKQSRPKGAAKKKLSLDSSVAASPLPREPEVTEVVAERSVADGLWELFTELIMWKNAAKSSLWFGVGSIFFLSSSFSREYGFSVISAASHLGMLVLALAFFRDSVPQRQQVKWRGEFRLTEEDIVRAARVVLPVANAVLAKSGEIFSGEPSMTLKVAPILLFAAKYGHLITPWRLFATGFFMSFTAPKLYSSYSQQIHNRVETVRSYVSETWKSCRHKKFVAASTSMVLWNLFSAKTRICAAFLSVVILRYHHQRRPGKDNSEMSSMEEEEQQQSMVV